MKRKSDRVPALTAGGSRKVKSSTGKVTAGDVFFGYEFGGGARPTTQQFPPWLGTHGLLVLAAAAPGDVPPCAAPTCRPSTARRRSGPPAGTSPTE